MLRDELYEAAAKVLVSFDSVVDTPADYAPLIVDEVLDVLGIDPDKTYFEHVEGTTLLSDYWVSDRDGNPNGYMRLVRVGGEATE